MLHTSCFASSSSFLFFFLVKHLVVDWLPIPVLLQKSIDDKLANLKKEKRNIKQEIDRISPELQKVIS